MPISAESHARRRRAAMDAYGADAIAVFPAAPEVIRSNDTEYRFRQNSDFFYLTGFNEPDAVCVLQPGHPTEEYILFVRPRDPERETWTGHRAGVEGAVERFGASAAFPLDKLDELLPKYFAQREQLYYAIDGSSAFDRRMLGWVGQARRGRTRSGQGTTGILDSSAVVHEQRLHKEPEEIECLRSAIAISAAAHIAYMRETKPGLREFEIDALIDFHFRKGGAAAPAYNTIVAAGRNATVLHYVENASELREGEMLLVDAGAELDFYCADITRTIPIGKRFEGRGKAVYEIVLAAQLAAVDAVKPGAKFDDVHQRAVEVLVDGLLQLGLITAPRVEILEKEAYKPFYMHRTSHWLGIDVHDMGDYKRSGESRILEPGMVLTVEPGLYLTDFIENLPADWRGIGVRIEDDVLVTTDGHDVLTAAVPKSIADIEALRVGA